MLLPSSFNEVSTTKLYKFIFTLCAIAPLLYSVESKSIFSQATQNLLGLRDPASTTQATIPTTTAPEHSRDIIIGPCVWAIGRTCPDKDIKFYLYTRRNIMDRQCLHIDDTLEKSNLTASHFNPRHPTKIIIHGYNADMFLSPIYKMRLEYLAKEEYNIIYIDWSILAPGPCYLSAVHNTKHGGACVAQLVERILDSGSADIHVIGFSLGAQLTNYIARNLGSFLLPRITGLDPAMPLFITAPISDKLDPSDAVYVDVIHTNAMVQGKLERCGHSDFYMNGGIMQPGCYSSGSNPFACSHQRASDYFLESIRSRKGFWGWSCSSYIAYLLNMCPPTNNLLEAGENVRHSTKGMFFVNTNDTSPYALGKWTDLPTLGAKYPTLTPTITLAPPKQSGDPLLKQIDQWGKLDYTFNNVENLPTPFSQDPNGENWTYFSGTGTDEITNDLRDNHDYANNYNYKAKLREGSRPVEWSEYRKNLTAGFIDNSVFSVPQIRAA